MPNFIQCFYIFCRRFFGKLYRINNLIIEGTLCCKFEVQFHPRAVTGVTEAYIVADIFLFCEAKVFEEQRDAIKCFTMCSENIIFQQPLLNYKSIHAKDMKLHC